MCIFSAYLVSVSPCLIQFLHPCDFRIRFLLWGPYRYITTAVHHHIHSLYDCLETYAEPVPVLGVAALVLGTTMNRCPLIVTTDWRPVLVPPLLSFTGVVVVLLLGLLVLGWVDAGGAGQQPLNVYKHKDTELIILE